MTNRVQPMFVRVTEKNYQWFKKLADDSGMSMSELCDLMIEQARESLEKQRVMSK